MFNRGLCLIYLQEVKAGLEELKAASKEKKKLAHDVIDESIKDKAKVGVMSRYETAR